jgi:hypothetical protein
MKIKSIASVGFVAASILALTTSSNSEACFRKDDNRLHGCSFDSDCKGNGKCKGGQCGGCGFDSDCSVGKCKSGQCGACGFDSDCRGGKCSGGRCSNAM